MSTQVQLRRGTAAQHANFVGAPGEITYVTDENTIRVHDGVTPGGHEVSDADLRQAFDAHLAEKVTDINGVHGFKVEGGTFTPFIAGATDYSVQEGHYTRQGDLVHITGRLKLTTKAGLTDTSFVDIRGLPFVSEQDSSVALSNLGNILFDTTNIKIITAYVIKDTSIIGLFKTGNNIGAVSLRAEDVSGGFGLIFSTTYKIKGV